MPKVRYTYRVDGEEFSEEDILPPDVTAIDFRAKQLVMLWNEKAEARGETQRELVKTEIIDHFIHEHDWVVMMSAARTGLNDLLECQNCNVTAQRRPGHNLKRDQKYSTDYYEFCHEKPPQLRPPKFIGVEPKVRKRTIRVRQQFKNGNLVKPRHLKGPTFK